MFYSPQMAPYNWLYLFLLFNMIMIYLTSHNYYIPPKNLKSPNLPPLYNFKWKW